MFFLVCVHFFDLKKARAIRAEMSSFQKNVTAGAEEERVLSSWIMFVTSVDSSAVTLKNVDWLINLTNVDWLINLEVSSCKPQQVLLEVQTIFLGCHSEWNHALVKKGRCLPGPAVLSMSATCAK